MFRRIVLTSVSVVALSVAANAADIYVPGPVGPGPGGYKDAPWYPTWAGFYVGANVGGAWSQLKVRDIDEVPGTFTNNASGVFGGATIGYNFQRGGFVFGPEIDLGGMNLSHSQTQPGTGGLIVSKVDSGFYGDVTGRLGYSWGPALLYGKAGFAFYDGSVSITDIGEATSKVTGLTGWTAGGGIEYMVSRAWSIKAEYMHFDFGRERLVMPTDGDRYDNKLTVDTVKAGINYHFGSGYVPLK